VLDLRQLVLGELEEVDVERRARVDPFWIPSSPAIKSAEKARYGLHDGSGGRNSSRLEKRGRKVGECDA